MTILTFTYNSSGKFALVPNDNIIGQAQIYNTSGDLLLAINNSIAYKLGIDGSGNYFLTGKVGLNYLSAIVQSGTTVTSISWSNNPGAALTTNNINLALQIAQTISANF